MTESTCVFDQCDKPVKAHGLCAGHESQQRRGQVLRPLRQRARSGSLMEWICEAVRQESDECILWPFTATPRGYGQVAVEGRNRRAHAIALNLVQPWHPPYGPYALHSCDNPPCVNPSHLSWGTASENMRQMWERDRHPRWKGFENGSTKTECKYGHPFDDENVYIVPSTGYRDCRTCRRRRTRESYLRRKKIGLMKSQGDPSSAILSNNT